MAMTKEEIELIADMVTENITNAHKEVLTSKEAAKYMKDSVTAAQLRFTEVNKKD